MPTLRQAELTRFVAQLFAAAGAPQESAQLVADSLVLSEMAGHSSHGIVRVRQYLEQIGRDDIDPQAQPEIVLDNGAVFNVDARKSFGQVSARFTMTEAIRRAKQYGISAAGLFHSGHVGRLGEWVEMAAERDAIAFGYCNGGGPSPGRVTPFGGLQPLLGTNPVAAAVPLGERPPLVIDFATSAVAEGKVRVARNLGKSIPEGWILDKHGNPTTNPADLYDDGVLLPAAGHKGYGLSLLVELLAGVLAGNSCPGLPDYSPRNGVLFIVLDVAAFQPADQFNATTGAYAGVIKALKPAPGFQEVLLPGEPEFRNIDQRRAEGISVDDASWGYLLEKAAEYGIPLPQA